MLSRAVDDDPTGLPALRFYVGGRTGLRQIIGNASVRPSELPSLLALSACHCVVPDMLLLAAWCWQVGMATLRRDGFTSLEIATTTSESAGVAVTKPLVFAGTHMFVNFGVDGDSTNDISTGYAPASLVVAVLDAATSKPIAPFHASTAITKDSVRQPVTWAAGGAGDLSAVAGKPVRLQFTLTGNGAQLFSFWVAKSKCGESSGFVAAGGKGFTGMSDTNGSCV